MLGSPRLNKIFIDVMNRVTLNNIHREHGYGFSPASTKYKLHNLIVNLRSAYPELEDLKELYYNQGTIPHIRKNGKRYVKYLNPTIDTFKEKKEDEKNTNYSSLYHKELIPCHLAGDIYFIDPKYIRSLKKTLSASGEKYYYEIEMNNGKIRYVVEEVFDYLIKNVNKEFLSHYK